MSPHVCFIIAICMLIYSDLYVFYYIPLIELGNLYADYVLCVSNNIKTQSEGLARETSLSYFPQ